MAMTRRQSRDMHLVATLRGISFFGDLVAIIALMVRVAKDGGDNASLVVAALIIANSIPPLVLSPIAGTIVDSVRTKSLLIPILLAQGVVAVGLGYWTNPYVTIVLVALLGCGVAFTQPGYNALLPHLVGMENLARAQGTVQAYFGVATIAGPAVGGLLVGAFGLHVPLYVDALTFVACGVGTMFIAGDRVPTPSSDEGDKSLSAGFRHLYHDGVLRPVTISAIVFLFAFGLVSVTEVFLVTRSMRASATAYGLLVGTFGIGTVVGALWAGRRESQPLSQVRVFLIGLAMLGAGFVAVGLSATVWIAIAPMVFAGLGEGILNTSVIVLFSLRTRDEIRGRVFAAINAIIIFCQNISYLIGGLLLTITTPRVVFVSGGAAAFAAIVILGPGTVNAARRGLDDPRANSASFSTTFHRTRRSRDRAGGLRASARTRSASR